jgi:hypothetical protein
VNEYLSEINALSIGAKIQRVRTMSDKEKLALYGYKFNEPGLAIELSNGMLLFAQQDAEGNGPGWLGYAPVTLFQAFNREG